MTLTDNSATSADIFASVFQTFYHHMHTRIELMRTASKLLSTALSRFSHLFLPSAGGASLSKLAEDL